MCFSFFFYYLMKIVKKCQIQYGANHEYSLRFYHSIILVVSVFCPRRNTMSRTIIQPGWVSSSSLSISFCNGIT